MWQAGWMKEEPLALAMGSVRCLSNQQTANTEWSCQGLSSPDLGGISLLVGRKRGTQEKEQGRPPIPSHQKRKTCFLPIAQARSIHRSQFDDVRTRTLLISPLERLSLAHRASYCTHICTSRFRSSKRVPLKIHH